MISDGCCVLGCGGHDPVGYDWSVRADLQGLEEAVIRKRPTWRESRWDRIRSAVFAREVLAVVGWLLALTAAWAWDWRAGLFVMGVGLWVDFR